MGLGNYEQNLIKSIAENDIREARKWAVAALNADTTQKNKGFVTRYKNILTSEGAGMIELPGNLKDILVCEDVSLLYRKDRRRRSFELKMPAGRRATQIDDLGIKKDKNLPH